MSSELFVVSTHNLYFAYQLSLNRRYEYDSENFDLNASVQVELNGKIFDDRVKGCFLFYEGFHALLKEMRSSLLFVPVAANAVGRKWLRIVRKVDMNMRKVCSKQVVNTIGRCGAVTFLELQEVKKKVPVGSYVAAYLSDKESPCFFGRVIFSGNHFVTVESYFNKNLRMIIRFWELLLMPESYRVLNDEDVSRLKEQLSQGQGLVYRSYCIYHTVWGVE